MNREMMEMNYRLAQDEDGPAHTSGWVKGVQWVLLACALAIVGITFFK